MTKPKKTATNKTEEQELIATELPATPPDEAPEAPAKKPRKPRKKNAEAPEAPEAPPENLLTWLPPKAVDSSTGGKMLHWVTQCGRYRATRVECLAEGVYYAASVNNGGPTAWGLIDQGDQQGSPKRHRTLRPVLEAVVAHLQGKLGQSVAHNNEDTLASAVAAEQAAAPAVKEKKEGVSTGPRTVNRVSNGVKVFEFSPTAVVRWMGQEGWTFDQAKKALTGYGVEVNDVTIKTSLNRGKREGNPAALSAAQKKELTAKRDA